MNRESSHTASSHTTSTAAPINNTRHAGRPRPSKSLAGRPAALLGARRGSRSRLMMATTTINSEMPISATT
jgi:hypothetical protein